MVQQAVQQGGGNDGAPEHRTVPHCWIGLFPKLQSPIVGIVFMVNALP
jgi:hypothetical protein